MTSTDGRGGVVAEAVKGAVAEIARAASAAAGEQGDMFALPTRFEDERGELARAAVARSRGPGRPPGAENKATAAFRDYLLRRGVHPLEQLMRWSMHTPETLSRELACSQLEAFRELRALWGELAPYFASKVAPTDQDGRAVPQFMMVLGGGGGVGAAPGVAPWRYLEGEQNQALEPPADPVSHVDVSHGVAK